MMAAKETRDCGVYLFPAQIECGLHWSHAGEELAHVPILVAEVCGKPVAPSGIAPKRPGERCHQTALLAVPAEQRHDVDRTPFQVEIFRVYLLIRKPAKDGEQLLKCAVAQPVPLLRPKQQVKLSVGQRLQIEMINGKNLQAFNPACAGEQLFESKRAGRREGKRVIE